MALPKELKVDRRKARRSGANRDKPRVAKKTATWRRPSAKRVRALRDRLREIYGRPVNEPHGDPVAELVRTILSQNTNDRNRDVAFDRLVEKFPEWEEVRDAPTRQVETALRPGGLAKTKAPRIQEVLRRIGDPPDLEWLRTAPRDEAVEWLCDLPGVGRETAACVMVFTWDLPEIPVDTHVHRVGGRLGLFPPKASFEEAHEEMRAITPPDDAYEFHINLIRHGRAVCRPKPKCGECGLSRMCPWLREQKAGQSGVG